MTIDMAGSGNPVNDQAKIFAPIVQDFDANKKAANEVIREIFAANDYISMDEMIKMQVSMPSAKLIYKVKGENEDINADTSLTMNNEINQIGPKSKFITIKVRQLKNRGTEVSAIYFGDYTTRLRSRI